MADNSQAKQKKGYKRCSNCSAEQHMALKTCQECNSPFEKRRKKDLEKLKEKKTNITQQRHLMENRAYILHANHNCEVVILMYHKHGSGDTVTFYGTQGPGVAFIGNKKDKKSSQHGEMALQLFRKFMEDVKSHSSSLDSCSVSEQRVSMAQPTANTLCVSSDVMSDNPDPLSLESCSVPEQRLSVSSVSATCMAQPTANSFSAASNSQLYTSCASNVSNQSTSSIPHHQVNLPTAPMAPLSTILSSDHQTLQSVSISSPTSPRESEMVVYMVNKVPLAGGYIDHQRTSLHGKKVPDSHMCVMLTTAKPDIRAPFIAGDVEENAFLEKGKFFALPKTNLLRAVLKRN